MTHEKRMIALLALEEAFRGFQQHNSGPRIAQVGLIARLDVLARALNPHAEYDRATLAVLDKLRSYYRRPRLLTQVLAIEDKHSKALADKLRKDLDDLI